MTETLNFVLLGHTKLEEVMKVLESSPFPKVDVHSFNQIIKNATINKTSPVMNELKAIGENDTVPTSIFKQAYEFYLSDVEKSGTSTGGKKTKAKNKGKQPQTSTFNPPNLLPDEIKAVHLYTYDEDSTHEITTQEQFNVLCGYVNICFDGLITCNRKFTNFSTMAPDSGFYSLDIHDPVAEEDAQQVATTLYETIITHIFSKHMYQCFLENSMIVSISDVDVAPEVSGYYEDSNATSVASVLDSLLDAIQFGQDPSLVAEPEQTLKPRIFDDLTVSTDVNREILGREDRVYLSWLKALSPEFESETEDNPMLRSTRVELAHYLPTVFKKSPETMENYTPTAQELTQTDNVLHLLEFRDLLESKNTVVPPHLAVSTCTGSAQFNSVDLARVLFEQYTKPSIASSQYDSSLLLATGIQSQPSKGPFVVSKGKELSLPIICKYAEWQQLNNSAVSSEAQRVLLQLTPEPVVEDKEEEEGPLSVDYTPFIKTLRAIGVTDTKYYDLELEAKKEEDVAEMYICDRSDITIAKEGVSVTYDGTIVEHSANGTVSYLNSGERVDINDNLMTVLDGQRNVVGIDSETDTGIVDFNDTQIGVSFAEGFIELEDVRYYLDGRMQKEGVMIAKDGVRTETVVEMVEREIGTGKKKETVVEQKVVTKKHTPLMLATTKFESNIDKTDECSVTQRSDGTVYLEDVDATEVVQYALPGNKTLRVTRFKPTVIDETVFERSYRPNTLTFGNHIMTVVEIVVEMDGIPSMHFIYDRDNPEIMLCSIIRLMKDVQVEYVPKSMRANGAFEAIWSNMPFMGVDTRSGKLRVHQENVVSFETFALQDAYEYFEEHNGIVPVYVKDEMARLGIHYFHSYDCEIDFSKLAVKDKCEGAQIYSTCDFEQNVYVLHTDGLFVQHRTDYMVAQTEAATVVEESPAAPVMDEATEEVETEDIPAPRMAMSVDEARTVLDEEFDNDSDINPEYADELRANDDIKQAEPEHMRRRPALFVINTRADGISATRLIDELTMRVLRRRYTKNLGVSFSTRASIDMAVVTEVFSDSAVLTIKDFSEEISARYPSVLQPVIPHMRCLMQRRPAVPMWAHLVEAGFINNDLLEKFEKAIEKYESDVQQRDMSFSAGAEQQRMIPNTESVDTALETTVTNLAEMDLNASMDSYYDEAVRSLSESRDSLRTSQKMIDKYYSETKHIESVEKNQPQLNDALDSNTTNFFRSSEAAPFHEQQRTAQTKRTSEEILRNPKASFKTDSNVLMRYKLDVTRKEELHELRSFGISNISEKNMARASPRVKSTRKKVRRPSAMAQKPTVYAPIMHSNEPTPIANRHQRKNLTDTARKIDRRMKANRAVAVPPATGATFLETVAIKPSEVDFGSIANGGNYKLTVSIQNIHTRKVRVRMAHVPKHLENAIKYKVPVPIMPGLTSNLSIYVRSSELPFNELFSFEVSIETETAVYNLPLYAQVVNHEDVRDHSNHSTNPKVVCVSYKHVDRAVRETDDEDSFDAKFDYRNPEDLSMDEIDNVLEKTVSRY
ncbi:hypothetical protein PCE1_000243 [Barthelona sp. PCE]